MKGKYLILGTNLGNKGTNLQTAINIIQEEVGNILELSSIYETEAWGFKDQPTFYNQVIKIETSLSPQELLEKILAIELKMGRIRYKKWHERLIDIDILYYEDEIINEPSLIIPHPGIPDRKFTLIPLCELAGEEVHPGSENTLNHLLASTEDILKVSEIQLSN